MASPAEFDPPARKPKHRLPPAQGRKKRNREGTSETKATGRIREREEKNKIQGRRLFDALLGSVVRIVGVLFVMAKESERGSV